MQICFVSGAAVLLDTVSTHAQVCERFPFGSAFKARTYFRIYLMAGPLKPKVYDSLPLATLRAPPVAL